MARAYKGLTLADQTRVVMAGKARREVIARSLVVPTGGYDTTPNATPEFLASPDPIGMSLVRVKNAALSQASSATSPALRRQNRAMATRIGNQITSILTGGHATMKSVTTVGDGAELRHGYAIVNHLTSRGDLLTVLDAIGMRHLAPKSPSAEKHLGEAMKRLNNNDLIARRAEEDPPGVESRWFAGSLDLAMETSSLGDRDLVVDLIDGDLVFTASGTRLDGGVDSPLIPMIRSAFDQRTMGETYNATTMLAWLRWTLENRFYGRAFYDTVYVPPGSVALASKLVSALDASGVMGRRMVGLDTRASDTGLKRGLLVGFEAEIDRLAGTVEKDDRSPESLLVEIFRAYKAIDGFATLLGETYVTNLRGRVSDLHKTITNRVDFVERF
jgi:hypothetical protein